MGEEDKIIAQRLDDHIRNDDLRFDILDKANGQLVGDVKTIKDNHLAHLKTDIATLDNKVGNIQTDIDWLKRFFWLITTASLGSLIGAIANLLLKF